MRKTTNILVVDDEPAIREGFKALLSHHGFGVVSASNGNEAVQLAKQELPDLILCDWNMPEMNGFEVLAILRKDPTTGGIPFVFLTGLSDKASVRQAMLSGADDYLTKPCRSDELLSAIRTRLERKEQIAESSTRRMQEEQLLWRAEILEAIRLRQFELYYQPKTTLAKTRITGAEALLRWNHPSKGPISPGVFIPVAEQTGAIIDLGLWTLSAACRELQNFKEKGFDRLSIAVNVSGMQLYDSDFPQVVKEMLDRYAISPSSLELELTESALLHNPLEAAKSLREIRKLGVSLAMDDFGTGYSSLSYLSNLPFTSLKIDRSFVQEVVANPRNAAIVRSVIELAHILNLKAIAEGVETEAERRFLKESGCDEMQGFLFARPMDTAAFHSFLSANNPA